MSGNFGDDVAAFKHRTAGPQCQMYVLHFLSLPPIFLTAGRCRCLHFSALVSLVRSNNAGPGGTVVFMAINAPCALVGNACGHFPYGVGRHSFRRSAAAPGGQNVGWPLPTCPPLSSLDADDISRLFEAHRVVPKKVARRRTRACQRSSVLPGKLSK